MCAYVYNIKTIDKQINVKYVDHIIFINPSFTSCSFISGELYINKWMFFVWIYLLCNGILNSFRRFIYVPFSTSKFHALIYWNKSSYKLFVYIYTHLILFILFGTCFELNISDAHLWYLCPNPGCGWSLWWGGNGTGPQPNVWC